ncbi:MAG: histidine triad nucleotide-binding protein [Bdellovibrionales bacterium]
MFKEDCIFCKIIQGKIPAQKVYEDEEVLGFKDISPITPIHYLFVPKFHVDSLAEVTDFTILSKMHKALVQVAAQEQLSERGYRVVINTGTEGGQTVFHMHLHLLGGRQLSARIN